ncbi:hypothetical protein PFICI_14852 [Pestalotiopsis fici W106-1]|uniref:DNA repair metallo-beta-lactamase domain-containing protein n=1 Tax=Pestalotiopsis fici (strain W106-1 / CGMCC3.15140) TaxID=1229662 RepID=W3WJE5_PESFW|nr:uncharacterized protein PFICI_14852 [Pestalotiopsis fici W106-1]ETS73247.1 hypothetical protein PFICI_14852 [Pestalotiopsis fici W106-1]
MALVNDKHSLDESISKDVENKFESILWSMIRLADERRRQDDTGHPQSATSLPTRITFPYARHSAYPELRHLIETFRPKDVWPNTVDLSKWAERDTSMRRLFGTSCSGTEFRHDLLVHDAIQELRQELSQEHGFSQGNSDTQTTSTQGFSSPFKSNEPHGESQYTRDLGARQSADVDAMPDADEEIPLTRKRSLDALYSDGDTTQNDSQSQVQGNEPRRRAFQSMIQNLNNDTWQPIHLISTTDHHSELEAELGQP